MTETLFDHHGARAARYRNGLTVAQAADRIGVTRWALYKYESGVASPPPDVLTRLAATYTIPPDQLLRPATTSGDAA